jgi:hypothetical protein
MPNLYRAYVFYSVTVIANLFFLLTAHRKLQSKKSARFQRRPPTKIEFPVTTPALLRHIEFYIVPHVSDSELNDTADAVSRPYDSYTM